MKPDQLQQAQNLFFQTDLTKSEIAEKTGISRRTIHNWANMYEWDRQKKNSENMPVYIAENCYHIMGHLTEEILSTDRRYEPITTSETNNLYKLTQTVSKLNARATLNESMEVLLRFSDSVANEDPDFASKMQPWIDKFIAAKAKTKHDKDWSPKLNYRGLIPRKDPAIQEKEEEIDMSYFREWQKQKREKEAAQAKAAEQQTKNEEPIVAPVTNITPVAVNTNETVPPATAPASAEDGPVPQTTLTGGEAPRATPPLTIAEKLRAEELAKPKPDIRKLLRGTSTTGPSKVLRQPIAA